MTEQLGRHAALVLLAAMTLGLVAGLLAWGPVPLGATSHVYADMRQWWGLANAFNVLADLLLLLTAGWGWWATQTRAVAPAVRRAWSGFQLFSAGGAVLSAVYHLRPTDTLYLASHFALAVSYALLSAGLLAERIHPRFGAWSVLALGTAGVAAMVLLGAVGATNSGAIDMRPILLIEALPVLLIPAGVLSVPGTLTRTRDWLLMLLGYTSARAFALADHWIFEATGWISGHSLMHLALAFVSGWLAYCATRASAGAADPASTQRRTSLNTAS